MFEIRPLNATAETTHQAIIPSKGGIVIAEGFSAIWKRRTLPILKRASSGDVLTPGSTRRIVVGSANAKALSTEAIKAALANPSESDLAVFCVSPESGKFLLRVSQIAMALGIIYLVGGIIVGFALPAGLRYASITYGGSLSTEKVEKIKKVIGDFGVFKESKIDDQTKRFFEAIKTAKGETKKEETK